MPLQDPLDLNQKSLFKKMITFCDKCPQNGPKNVTLLSKATPGIIFEGLFVGALSRPARQASGSMPMRAWIDRGFKSGQVSPSRRNLPRMMRLGAQPFTRFHRFSRAKFRAMKGLCMLLKKRQHSFVHLSWYTLCPKICDPKLSSSVAVWLCVLRSPLK